MSKFFIKRPLLKEASSWASCGPLNMNLTLCRMQGWSEKAINRAFTKLCIIAQAEAAIAHRNGRVKGCPCILCDPKARWEHIPEEYKKKLSSWRKRGLIK